MYIYATALSVLLAKLNLAPLDSKKRESENAMLVPHRAIHLVLVCQEALQNKHTDHSPGNSL